MSVLSRCLDKLRLKCGEASFLFWMRITSSPEQLQRVPDPVTLPFPHNERDEKHRDFKISALKFIDPIRTRCFPFRNSIVLVFQMIMSARGTKLYTYFGAFHRILYALGNFPVDSSIPHLALKYIFIHICLFGLILCRETHTVAPVTVHFNLQFICIRCSDYPPCQALQ